MTSNPSETSNDSGLYGKYEVHKNGEPVEDCFVLEPESDEAAFEALKTYALETDDTELFADLQAWIDAIEAVQEASPHIGPIIFSHRTARSQLLNHGEVVTFRTSQRTTGQTWWRTSRTGEKMGDVEVEFIRDVVHAIEMSDYVDRSGFASLDDWTDAIAQLNGAVDEGYLYRAAATEGECGRCGETAPLPTNRFCPPCERAEATELAESREGPR